MAVRAQYGNEDGSKGEWLVMLTVAYVVIAVASAAASVAEFLHITSKKSSKR